MVCARCGSADPQGTRFCVQCGARLTRSCAHCQAELPAEAAFCGECGRAVPADGRVVPLEAPGAYTPRHLAERILTARSTIEGERKLVTVLFADLKGSLEAIADRDPEEARELLDPVLEILMEAVHRYEGTVNQVLGDGIMALFGAPLALEDHAVRACYAALRMQDAVKAYADDVRRSHGVALRIRVGINSGEVVVRTIGNDLRMDYSAVGPTTHLAARMEQLADPGRVVVAPNTARLVEGYFELKSLGRTAIRGLPAPIEIHELTGAGAARSRLRAHLVRGLTPFVAREAELEHLAAALQRADERHGQVVALVGEPGVGKSRLCWEFTHTVVPPHWLVLEASAVSYGTVTPFLPIVEMLRGCFGLDAADTAEQARDKVASRVLLIDPGLASSLPWLSELLQLGEPEPEGSRIDPSERRRRILDATKRLFIRWSLERPILIMLEDLQWIDPETQAFLDTLVESLTASRIVLLVSYRPGYQHGWAHKSYYQQLHLGPLAATGAATFMGELLGHEPDVEPVKALLLQRTGGNPLFLEESVRTLAESRVLVGERGHYRLTRPLDTLQVPPTVQAVLASRIDRLEPDDKHLLQSAAVIGETVPYRLLQSVSDLDEDVARRGLSRLKTAELLYEGSLFPDLELAFTHALTHEVAYGSLLLDRRHALHVRILEAIEAEHAGQLADHVERLAHHAFHGEAWDKAFDYLRQAAQRAVARAAYDSAVELFERAIEVLERQPAGRERLQRAVDVHLELRAALVPLARYKEILECLSEADALAAQAGDERRRALVHAFLTNYFQITGDPDRAIEFGRRALTTARAFGDRAVQVLSTGYLSTTSFVTGDFAGAIEFAHETLATLTEDLLHDRLGMTSLPAVYARLALVRSLAEQGEFGAALERANESIAISLDAGDRVSLSMSYHGLGYLRLRQGAPVAAVEPLETALDIARTANPISIQQIASTLAGALVASGRPLDGLRLVEEAASHASSMPRRGLQLGIGFRLGAMSETYAALGRLEEALNAGREALEIYTARKARGYAAWTLRLLGLIRAADGQPDAEALYEQARALAVELGMRPLVARCDVDLGRLYSQRHQTDDAVAALGRAIDTFRQLGMAFWRLQAEAYLAETR
jgi:class 3 adenylate cyclase/tetratricopeptide (TPR) repeat protein